MAPRVSIHTQPPSQVQQNAIMTPSPKLRLELDKTDPRASRDGEMLFHGNLYRVSGELVSVVRGSLPQVIHSGDRVIMDSKFSGIRIDEKGTYYLDLSVTFVDGISGAETIRNIKTNRFEVY